MTTSPTRIPQDSLVGSALADSRADLARECDDGDWFDHEHYDHVAEGIDELEDELLRQAEVLELFASAARG